MANTCNVRDMSDMSDQDIVKILEDLPFTFSTFCSAVVVCDLCGAHGGDVLRSITTVYHNGKFSTYISTFCNNHREKHEKDVAALKENPQTYLKKMSDDSIRCGFLREKVFCRAIDRIKLVS